MLTVSVKPETVKKYTEIILDRVWLFFVVVGISLLICGTVGNFPFFGQIKSEYLQYVVSVVGGLFIAVAMHAFYRPNIGAKSQANSAIIDVESIGLTIASPKPGNVPNPVVLSGKIKGPLPPGYKLWLMNRGTVKSEPMLWPSMEIEPKAKSWSAQYTAQPLVKETEQRNLEIHLVGPGGQALIAYQRRVNHHFEAATWIGIHQSIADAVKDMPSIASVTVQLSKAYQGATR